MPADPHLKTELLALLLERLLEDPNPIVVTGFGGLRISVNRVDICDQIERLRAEPVAVPSPSITFSSTSVGGGSPQPGTTTGLDSRSGTFDIPSGELRVPPAVAVSSSAPPPNLVTGEVCDLLKLMPDAQVDEILSFVAILRDARRLASAPVAVPAAPPSEPVGPPHVSADGKQVVCPHCKSVLYNIRKATPRPFHLTDDDEAAASSAASSVMA